MCKKRPERICFLVALCFIFSTLSFAATTIHSPQQASFTIEDDDNSMQTFDTAIEDLCIAWKYRVRTREVCDSSLITNGLTSSHDTVRMRRLSMLPTVIDMTYN
nr:hypothetical protein [Paludibacteraceae bacterium]